VPGNKGKYLTKKESVRLKVLKGLSADRLVPENNRKWTLSIKDQGSCGE
jgi:hypothetical protein